MDRPGVQSMMLDDRSEFTRTDNDVRGGHWYVLHVKSRQEKTLAEDLLVRGIDYYLPLIRRIRMYGRRKANVEVPLFPGYLFLKGTLEQVYTADRTGRV